MDHANLISEFASRIADLVTSESASTIVPSCPEWNLLDLALHLGEVHEFWAANIRASDIEGPWRGERLPPAHSIDSMTWCREKTAALLAALSEYADESPCWTWWEEPRTAGAVARHQVQEAAIHCWDAENAVGIATPIPVNVAVDGIGEYLHVHRHAFDCVKLPGLKFSVTDSNQSWVINPDKEIESITSASASDLVLFLNGRKSLDEVNVQGALAGIAKLVSATPEINS
jgi:uncharacterized protein (TIGR03083 family)